MVPINEELDELDLQLLDALQRNARSTFTELASLVGLKPRPFTIGSSGSSSAALSGAIPLSSTPSGSDFI